MTPAQHARDLKRGARADYSRTVKGTRVEDKQIRAQRKKSLAKASDKCKTTRAKSRASVTAKCKARRGHIRADASAELSKTAAKRDNKRRAWKHQTGGVALRRGERRVGRAESDDEALKNIRDASLHGLFMNTRDLWDYDLQPHNRAEQFMEWVDTEPEDVVQWRMSEIPTDVAFVRAEQAAYQAEVAAVPF